MLIYTQTAPRAFAEVGWRFYILFIILPLVGAVLMWRIWPETKMLSLEEVGALFSDEVALDITHMNPEAKEVLDKELADLAAPDDEEGVRRTSINSLSRVAHGEGKGLSASHLEHA